MTSEERLQKEYHTYCCKMNSIINGDHALYKIMGYKEWKEKREQASRPEGVGEK